MQSFAFFLILYLHSFIHVSFFFLTNRYIHEPAKDHYEHGHKRGNEHHFIERHEKAHPHAGEFKTKVTPILFSPTTNKLMLSYHH